MRRAFWALTLAGALIVPTSASASTDYTWTGLAAPSSGGGPPTFFNWSNGANWQGGTAPSGSVGNLTFPALSSGCNPTPPAQPTGTCYHATNDIQNLSASGLTIDDGVNYFLDGSQALTLGANGLTAAPTTNDNSPGPHISFPIVLGADQTWSVTGGSTDQQLGVSGGVTGLHALTISFDPNSTSAPATFLNLTGDNEVGAVSISGNGTLGLGNPGQSGSLNGTNGNPVSLSGGAELLSTKSGSIGALTLTGGSAHIGSAEYPSQLTVNGGVILNSNPDVSFIVEGTTTPGTDYSQVSATGDVALGTGAQLAIQGSTSSSASQCPTLNVGDVLTLISTPGTITGHFANAPDGSTVPVTCMSGTSPVDLQINYTLHSVTGTVVAHTQTATTTDLQSSVLTAVTNQRITLTATVGAGSSTPSGFVKFLNKGVAIQACQGPTGQGEPVGFNSSTGTYMAICHGMFSAKSSPEELSASYIPSDSSQAGSNSSTVQLVVHKASSATALSVSNAKPAVGATVTYKALVGVAFPGPFRPTGTVEFLDNGVPAACREPGGATQPVSGATCMIVYKAKGSHAIVAKYSGDGNFLGSKSPAKTVTVQ